ncbi:MAG: FxsA family protein [Candidatus Omnitrophota bacterium]
MFPYLIILFTVLPAIELLILIEVGSHIGALNTILLIIVTGVVGASLARMQGFIVLNKIKASLERGQLPSAELLDGLMILTGGIVLLTPGFVSDVIGLFLLIPVTRSIIKLLVQKKMEEMIKTGNAVHIHSRTTPPDNYNDIDI